MSAARWARAAAGWGILLALFATAPSAEARPTLWQRAREPLAAKEAWLLAGLERTLDARELAYREPALIRDIARAAVAMSDVSGIRSPSDPRLAWVMAEALLIADMDRERDARRLLEGALETLPPGPLRADVLRRLGVVLAGLAEPLRSREVYTEALELELSSRERANLFYNRAEASLELDELEAAVTDYRRALDLAMEPDVFALVRYGLAVALERLGDLPAALDELGPALGITLPFPVYGAPDPLDLPGVFFVPAYERYYIEALRAMASLRQADSRAQFLVESSVAIQAWDAYLAAAPSTVPYRKNAEAHRKRLADRLKRPPPSLR